MTTLRCLNRQLIIWVVIVPLPALPIWRNFGPDLGPGCRPRSDSPSTSTRSKFPSPSILQIALLALGVELAVKAPPRRFGFKYL